MILSLIGEVPLHDLDFTVYVIRFGTERVHTTVQTSMAPIKALCADADLSALGLSFLYPGNQVSQ
jgi:hypothetical protein